MGPTPVLLYQIIWMVRTKHLCLKKTPRWLFTYPWLKKLLKSIPINRCGYYVLVYGMRMCICINSTMVCFKSHSEFCKYLSLINLCPITIHQRLFREWKLISILVWADINKWGTYWERENTGCTWLAFSRLKIIWMYFLFLSYFLN